jgi:membrane fusion protein, multidrug efflux system
MIRRIIYLFLVTVLLGGLAGGIGYYAFDWKPKFLAKVILGAPRPPETISAEAARTEDWQPQIAGIGTLTASEGIEITPQVSGVVSALHFESGQSVKRGDLLVTLNSDTEAADLRSLQAQLVNAETELARKRGLADKKIVAQAEVDTQLSLRDVLLANIDRVRAVIAQKSIYAPWDGRLGLKDVAVGKYVAAGQALVWLQNIDPIYADFTATEADFGRIKVGLKVSASFNAYPDEVFPGEIVSTDARMSNSSRMITVRAKLANADRRLVPGMYADVLVDSGAPQSFVTVPQTAVTYSLYGDSVFVVAEAKSVDPNTKKEVVDHQIEKRFVKVGGQRGNRVAIVNGLAAGDQVVTAGQNKIDQGSKVVVDNSIALKLQDTTSIQ